MVAEQQSVQSQFVNRVSALPSVEAAVGIAVSSYNKIKEASPAPLKAVIAAGEKTTEMAFATSQPILNKLQGPIQYVDSIACQGLDRVEASVPSVKETPEKIYADVKEFGSAKVSSVRDTVMATIGTPNLPQFGLGMVTPEKLGEYREQLVTYATLALTAAEGALDSHLASAGAEAPEMSQSGEDLKGRMGAITAKARLCVSHHTTGKFVAAQKYASDGVGRIVEALQVIRAVKANVQEGKPIQEIAKELKFEWLSKLLEQAKEKAPAQQALFVAQEAAAEVREALTKVSGDVKTKVNDAYGAVVSRANSLSESLRNLSVTQMSSSVLSTLQEQAVNLQQLIHQVSGLNLSQYLPEIKALQATEGGSQ